MIYSHCTLLLFRLVFLLFPLSKVHQFLWKPHMSWGWTELGDIPKHRQKAWFKYELCHL